MEDTGVLGCELAKSPMQNTLKLCKDCGLLLTDPTSYLRLIRRLFYLTHTRPDITYDVHTLSQFLDSPGKSHLDVIHHVLCYIKTTVGQGLFLTANNSLHLKGFSDSDWAACIDTR